MASNISQFESVVRRAHRYTEAAADIGSNGHPFDVRNLHPDFPEIARRLFDNGHFSQATFEAFKFVDEELQRISGSSEFGTKLAMSIFGGDHPVVKLNPGMTTTEKGEQEGFKFLFAGAFLAVRNPRGHSSGISDDLDLCLDHLTLASFLLRRLEEAGLR